MTACRDLLVQINPPAVTISLNRPDKLNALHISMVSSLLETLRRLERDENVHIVVLRGEGRAFCAGGDIEVMRNANETGSVEDVERVTRTFQETIGHICESAKLFVSFVHGAAMGGGAGLALAADLVYAMENARFGWPYANLGLSPDGGASFTLTNALGKYKALEALLFGRTFTAAEMEKLGLVNEVFTEQEWEERTNALLRNLSAFPAQLLAGLKRLIREAGSGTGVAPLLALEYRMMVQTAESAFHKEKVREFFARKTNRGNRT